MFLEQDLSIHDCLKQEFGNDVRVPSWSKTWPGGLALSRYILDNPNIVKGKTVVDFCCGSGMVGIASMMAGADKVICVDNNSMALTCAQLNAAANKVTVKTSIEIEDGDIILAGDPTPAVDVFNVINGFDHSIVGCPNRNLELLVNFNCTTSYFMTSNEFPAGTDVYIYNK